MVVKSFNVVALDVLDPDVEVVVVKSLKPVVNLDVLDPDVVVSCSSIVRSKTVENN